MAKTPTYAEENLKKDRAILVLRKAGKALLHAADEAPLIREICRIAVEEGGYLLAWVGMAENDPEKNVRPVGRWGLGYDYVDELKITWDESPSGQGPTGKAIRTGSPQIVKNVADSPDYGPWRNAALGRGYRSSIALPLVHGDVRIGALNIYAPEPDAFDRWEVDLLMQLAEELSYGIASLRTRKRHEKAEAELARIFNMSLDLICVADINTATFLRVNPAFEQALGYSEEELLNQPFLNFIHPDDVENTLKMVTENLRRGEKTINFENRYRCRNGEYKWLSWVSHPIPEEGVTYAVARDVTALKAAERELARSKSLLDATGRMARVGGWEVEVATMALRWTEETYRIHEVPFDYKPPIREAIDFFHPEDRPKLQRAIRRAMDHGEPYDMEIRFISAKGNHLWTRTICEPEIVEGKVVRLRGMFQDITGRRNAEKQLKDQNLFISTIIDNLPIGLAVNYFDEGTATYINPQFENIYGWPKHQLRDIAAFFEKVFRDPVYREKARARVLADIASGDPERMQWDDLKITTEKGEERIVFAKNIPLLEQNIMISTVQDVTERKRAEEALRSSHERFLKVMDGIDASIYVAALDTHEILFMNRHLVEAIGRDMTGEKCWKMFGDQAGPCAHCAEDPLLDQTGRPTDGHVWQGKHPATGRWQMNHDRVIDWMEGRLVKLQVAMDITELKKMEEDLRQAQKMEAIGRLAGGIAHEFNNMLGIILGYSELALEEIPEWNPAAEFVTHVRNASLRAKDVVRKLLSVARKAPSSPKPIRIGPIVEESLHLLRKTIPATIDIRGKRVCELETVLADPTEIHQILINLFTNCVHAIKEETGIIEVDLASMRIGPDVIVQGAIDSDASGRYKDMKPGAYAKLTVADNGAGIDPDIIGHVFDPYFTTKQVNEGLGMGLAVVHGIVKKHDGDIFIESKLGEGTVVEVLFPLMAESLQTDTQIPESPATGSEIILFIDDEAPLVQMAGQILTRAGYDFVGKTNPAEALRAFSDDPLLYDLVITDMAMPEMPGDRLAREMMRLRPDIPIVLCTGHSERIDAEKARQMGIRALVLKPLTKTELTRVVRDALDGVK